MSYHHALSYLASKTSVIELCDQLGGRVVISPEWNGRIMTSSCNGLDGDSFGCVNVTAIENNSYEDFGGEDVWTLSPLITPFMVASIKEEETVLQQTIQTSDANGKPIEFHLKRSISLLNQQKIRSFFGDEIGAVLKQTDVSAIGFCSENTVFSPEKAAIISRQRGMFNATPHSAVMIPMPTENEAEQLEIDYFGGSPHGRIRHLPQTLLLRADGMRRCQVHLRYDSVPTLGAIELRTGILTLWIFDLPKLSVEESFRIYNHGRTYIGEKDWTAYYEVNSFSTVQELRPEESLTYRQCTLHLIADNLTLAGLVQSIFDGQFEEISRKIEW